MEMIRVIERIERRIQDLAAQGRRVSERSVSIDATGSPDTIRNWRRSAATGKAAGASTVKLQQVADALGVSLNWLILGDEGADDSRSQAIAEIVELLRELDPAELEILRAAAKGVHDRHRGQS